MIINNLIEIVDLDSDGLSAMVCEIGTSQESCVWVNKTMAIEIINQFMFIFELDYRDVG